MRRAPLSKSELLLLLLPVVGFGLFAAWQTAARLKAPATLQSASVGVDVLVYGRNGAQIFGYGSPRDAAGRPQRGSYPVFLTWDAQSGDLKRQNAETRWVYRWAVSPDGRFLAQGDMKAVTVKDLNANLEVANFASSSGPFDWTPDNKSLMVYGKAGQIQLFDTQTGELQRNLDLKPLLPDVKFIQYCRFSPDNQKVAFLESPNYVSIKEPLTGRSDGFHVKGRVVVATWPQLKKVATLPGELCSDMRFSPNGNSITTAHVVSGGYQVLGVVLAQTDLRTKHTRWTKLEKLPRSTSVLYNARFSPDGRLFATDNVGGFEFWRVTDGKLVGEIPAVPLKKGQGYQSRPTFSPDGRFLIRPRDNDVERFDLTRFLPLEKTP